MGIDEEFRSAIKTAPQAWHISGAIAEILLLRLGGDSRWVGEQEPNKTEAALGMRPVGLNSSLIPHYYGIPGDVNLLNLQERDTASSFLPLLFFMLPLFVTEIMGPDGSVFSAELLYTDWLNWTSASMECFNIAGWTNWFRTDGGYVRINRSVVKGEETYFTWHILCRYYVGHLRSESIVSYPGWPQGRL